MIIVDNTNTHFEFDSKIKPNKFVKSGEIVQFLCEDCYCGQIVENDQDFNTLNMETGNPVSGPLYIEEAQPGDILRVEIIEIDIEEEGAMCARDGEGVYEIKGAHCRRFSINEGMILFDHDIKVPIRPMIGVIGTAPKIEKVPTHTPGEHGGNLDIKDIGVGSLLYLPVEVSGALLSMGDIHAVQGDGETGICALEIQGKVTIKIDVLKNRQDIPTPFIISKGHYLTTAAHESLDEASINAARKMHVFLQDHTQMSDVQCGMLLSLAGNLRISQVVNPRKGCVMEFPIGLAKEKFQK